MVGTFESVEFVFIAQSMFVILGYTNELSECLQRREQDILNAISLVNVAKSRMQQLRSDGWNQFLERVILFCNKHGVQVPSMEDNYVPYGKSACMPGTKQMMTTSEEKYILVSLINLVKSLIIGLMR
jgi:hypothetical protein